MVILKREFEHLSKALFQVSILKQLIVLEDLIAFICLESLKLLKLSP